MTIKIERDSPLRVIDTSSSSHLHQQGVSSSSGMAITTVEDDFVVVDFQPLCSSLCPVGKLRSSTMIDDDTASTGSMSSDSYDDSSSEQQQRRVSFADDLVTQVWTRPFTPRAEVTDLFYSTEDTSRFRQEYRLERKLLSELSVDPEMIHLDDKDLAALVSPTHHLQQAYHISRVVVLHDNKLETFVDEPKQADCQDDFFDNDSFWSGSITWY